MEPPAGAPDMVYTCSDFRLTLNLNFYYFLNLAPETPGPVPGTPGPAPGSPGPAPGSPGPVPGLPGPVPGTQGHLRAPQRQFRTAELVVGSEVRRVGI